MRITEHLFIAESDHAVALAIEPSRSFQIMQLRLGEIMTTAINLNDQTGRVANKISNVAPDERLSAHVEVKFAQLRPKPLFGQGHGAAQTARLLNSAGMVMGGHQ